MNRDWASSRLARAGTPWAPFRRPCRGVEAGALKMGRGKRLALVQAQIFAVSKEYSTSPLAARSRTRSIISVRGIHFEPAQRTSVSSTSTYTTIDVNLYLICDSAPKPSSSRLGASHLKSSINNWPNEGRNMMPIINHAHPIAICSASGSASEPRHAISSAGVLRV